MVVAEKPLDGALSLIAPDGHVATTSSERHGGAPYSWFAEVATPAAGTWHATLAVGRMCPGHARNCGERAEACTSSNAGGTDLAGAR